MSDGEGKERRGGGGVEGKALHVLGLIGWSLASCYLYLK